MSNLAYQQEKQQRHTLSPEKRLLSKEGLPLHSEKKFCSSYSLSPYSAFHSLLYRKRTRHIRRISRCKNLKRKFLLRTSGLVTSKKCC